MQAVVALLAGMILLGSVILRVRTFERRRFLQSLTVAAFVYLSMAVGLLLSNHAEVFTFQSKVAALVPPVSSLSEGIRSTLIIGALVAAVFIGRWRGSIILGIAAYVLLFSIITADYTLKDAIATPVGAGLTFGALMVLVAAVNSLAGVVAVGLNLAFIIIQLGKGEAINLFSLLNFVDVIHAEGYVLSIAIMFVSSAVGSLELVIATLGLGD